MVLDRSIAKNDSDVRLFDNIEKFDCHVISVANKVGETGPIFTYSIGLKQTLNVPELLIVGLNGKLAHAMINLYRDDVKHGKKFVAGNFYNGFLEGFDVLFIEANDTARKDYAIWADWYYERKPFPIMQCLWPSTNGAWPWQETASDYLKEQQPIVGKLPEDLP